MPSTMGSRRATLAQLRRHRVPTWWSDAKLGIFIHWTPASIPGFAPCDADLAGMIAAGNPEALAHSPYTEWYENSLRFEGSPVAQYHRRHYGDRPYAEFAGDFVDALDRWDPDDWAARFARAGARYVVLVAKHHDGFCLWPTAVTNPHRKDWFTQRDVVGELAHSVRAAGMRFGVYYSGGLDWTFEQRPIGSLPDMLASVPGSDGYADYAEAQLRELVERYQPSILWNDIAWPFGGRRLWQMFADYYAAVPEGVVNDRWMPRNAAWDLLGTRPVASIVNKVVAKVSRGGGIIPPKPPHFDVRTPEYVTFDHLPADPWECCRGMDRSFGYNRDSLPEHFLRRDELLESLVDVVANGGNLLLNVGPRGEDAAIVDDQQLRLDWLGAWLDAFGTAVRCTSPWVRQQGVSPQGHRLRYTARGDDVHVIVLDGPTDRITLVDVVPGVTGGVRVAGGDELPWTIAEGGDVVDVDLSGLDPGAQWPLALTVSAAVARPLALTRR